MQLSLLLVQLPDKKFRFQQIKLSLMRELPFGKVHARRNSRKRYIMYRVGRIHRMIKLDRLSGAAQLDTPVLPAQSRRNHRQPFIFARKCKTTNHRQRRFNNANVMRARAPGRKSASLRSKLHTGMAGALQRSAFGTLALEACIRIILIVNAKLYGIGLSAAYHTQNECGTSTYALCQTVCEL